MYNYSYLGNNQYGSNFGGYGSAQTQYQTPNYLQRPSNIQQQTQFTDVPFIYVGYGTLDEVKAYLVPPTKAVMFIDKNKSQFYIKSCDNMGNSTIETFDYTKPIENTSKDITTKFDPKEFVKTSDLDNVLKKEDAKYFLTVDDVKGFSTKKDFETIIGKISSIESEIKKLNRLSQLLGANENKK